MLRVRPIPLLTASVGVVGANSLVLQPIAVIVAQDLASTTGQILQASAAYGLGTAISALILAPRADRIGADRALMQAALILIVALAASMLAPSTLILTIAQAVAGIGAGMALPAIYSLAPYVAPEGKEKQTIGTVLSGWTISIVGGVTVSALIADAFGWRAVYGLLTAGTVLIALLLRASPLSAPRSANASASPFEGLRVFGIWRGLLANGMLMLGFYGVYSFLGAHIVENLGKSTSAAGVITLFYGTGFGITVLLDKYLDRVDARRASIVVLSALIGVYLAMMAGASQFYLLMPVAFVWGVFQHLSLNLMVARLTALDPMKRGAIMGLNSTVTYLGVMGGSLVFRFPYEAGGLRLCAVGSAICIAITVIEALKPRRPVVI